MITEFGEGKYYLYRHIRLDKNEPFYIGIGTKAKKGNPYYRSILDKGRNSIWNKITNKTTYQTEIILESNDYEFIKTKEKEFISLYGRIDSKTGILSNMTSGGEGIKDIIYTAERKKKLSLRFKGGRCLNQQWWNSTIKSRKRGAQHQCAKKVYQYDLEGNFIKEWGSKKDVLISLNIKISKKCVTNGGFQWKNNNEGNFIGTPNWTDKKNTPKKVLIYSEENIPFICFSKIKDAALFFNVSPTTIRDAINKQFKIKRKHKVEHV